MVSRPEVTVKHGGDRRRVSEFGVTSLPGTSHSADRPARGRRPSGRGPRPALSVFSRPSGIMDTGEGLVSSISMAIDVGHRVRVEHVGVDHQVVAVEVHDAAGDHAAVGRGDGDGAVLVADRLAGQDDRLQQVAGAEPAGDAREVGADAAALVVEAVAGEALGRGEEGPPAVEVATLQARLDDGGQLLERPLLDDRTRGLGRDGRRRSRPGPPGSASARPSPRGSGSRRRRSSSGG